MYRIILLIGIVLLSFALVSAQDASEKNTDVVIKADTEFSAKTSQSLSAETAKPGDDFNLTLTADLKCQEGSILKGAEVYGRILKVQKLSGENSGSEVTILFDYIKSGEEFISLHAVVTAIEGMPDAIKIVHSETIPGGTILSLTGKNLAVQQNTVLRLKVTNDTGSDG